MSKDKDSTKAGPKERLRVDFNRIVRNTWGESYRTVGGAPLRLGKVVVDAIEAASGARGATLESDEKLRLADLARKIVNTKLDDSVEAAPFTVLTLPRRIADQLDRHVAAAAFVTGVYASCNRLLYGAEAKVLSFDDIEEEGVPDEIEQDKGPVPDEAPKVEDEIDEANVETVPCAAVEPASQSQA